MADVHDAQTRSYNMSQIKGKNTRPEMIVRKFLFSKGFRYRLHVRKLAGKPDIDLPKLKVVVFVHGCFWHGHDNCRYFVIPKIRTAWWLNKIERNKQVDRENHAKLRRAGWKVFTIFECKLKSKIQKKTLERFVDQLETLKSNRH